MDQLHFVSGLKRLLPAAIFLLAGSSLFSQETPYTLQQCIEYGLTNNPNMLKAQIETDKDSYKRMEARSNYLPQVNGSVQVINNLQLQTSILPGEIIGQPGELVAVQFGTRYNVVGAVGVTQTLYDQAQIYNMQIAKQNGTIAELNLQKTKEQLIYDIATVYYGAQVSLTQKQLVADNLSKIDTLLKVTTIQFENGFAKKIDVDKLVVSQTNLQTELATSEVNYQQQLLLLKYYMGLPLETSISVPAIAIDEAPGGTLVNTETLNTTDVNILQAQRALFDLNLRQVRAGYIPTLNANFNFAYQLQQNNFRIFSNDANWFPNSYVGITLNVPIFDGLSKYARTSQIELQIKQSELDEQYLTESLKMQRSNAQNKLTINIGTLENQQRNIQLAEEVFETTKAQYIGGIASMTDLVNAESSLKEAQSNYLNALVQVKLAELELIRSTGNINTFN